MPLPSTNPEKDKIISIESVLDFTMEFAKDFKHSTLGRSASRLKRSLGVGAEKVEAPKSISQLVRTTSVAVTVGTGKVDVVTPSVRRTPSERTDPQSSRKPDSAPERKHSPPHALIVKENLRQEDGMVEAGKVVPDLAKRPSIVTAPPVRRRRVHIEEKSSLRLGNGNLDPPAEEVHDQHIAEPQPEVSIATPLRTATPEPVETSHPRGKLEYSSSYQEQTSSNRTPDSPLPPFASPSVDALQLTTDLPSDFDPTILALSGIRSEHVFDLTGHAQKLGVRPVFEGTYSNVWKGILNGNDKELVAMKVLRDLRVGEIKARRRLRREVGTWWCLRHENIVPLLGLAKDGEFGAFGAIISPWYENGTADEYLEKHKDNISTLQRINLFWDVAKGLQYLHTFTMAHTHHDSATDLQDGDIILVHGDLKPRNILVDDQGVARICDFGLLRLIRTGATIGLSTSTSHTGTTRYLSHEMISSDDPRPTTASDIHALACIGMEFVYSRLPYGDVDIAHARTDYWITKAIEEKKPPATRPSGSSGVESELWDLFGRCWSPEPASRPNAGTVCSFLQGNHQELARCLPL